MAGYCRQSASLIQPNEVVKAAPINSEFNCVRDAFVVASGHKHDGTTTEGAYVPIISDSNTYTKACIDTSGAKIRFYVNVSSAAQEQVIIQDGVVIPATDDNIDLGTSSVEFKNAYFDGTVQTDVLTVDENATVTGNLTVNGNTTIGNADSDTVTLTADVASPVIPSADDTHDLGAVGSEWRNLYVDGTAHIDSLVADTADINAGSIDGTIIGANSAAAGTFSTLTASNVIVGSINGNAATATALQNARTIGGVSFDGTGNINLPGVNATGNQDTSGNAATATALATARTIGGVSFDGTGNINLPGVNATGNQDTSGNAATATALETARTIAGKSFNGTGNITIAATDLSDTDQSLATSDNVQFGTVTANLTGNVTSSGTSGFATITASNTATLSGGLVLSNASISSTAQATTHTVIDNNASAFQFSSAGKAGILKIVSTDSSEGVTMSGTLNVTGNTTIQGDLTVSGTTTTINTTNTVVSDAIIELANGTSGSPSNDAGIVIERGSADNAFMGFDESADKFIVGTGSFTGASTGNLTITTGTLVANLEGNVTATTLGGTLSTAAQPNVTSLGTLGELTVDDVNINGKVITMTGDTSDTATITAGANGTLAITTTDAAGANGNITITADGTFEAVGTTITLDSGGAINLETDSLSIGNNGDTDVAVTFQGNTSDGVITWMEDEDEFKFSDDILMDSTKKIQFGDTASFIHQSADGTLTIDGEAIIDLNASTRVDVSGDIKVGGEVQTAKIAFTDGDDAITIADGGGITANTSLTLASGSTVTSIKNESSFTSNSNSALATQSSIKAYVDSVAGSANNVTGLSASGAQINTVAHPSTIASNLETSLSVVFNDAILLYDNDVGAPKYFDIDLIDTYLANTAKNLTNKTITSPIVSGLHLNDSGFTVEGSSADANETTVTFTNPTADRTITFPNATGTVALTSDIPSTALDDIQTGDSAVTLATTSGSITIDAEGSNQDIIFMGTDGSSHITALTIDMSAAGTLIANSGIQSGSYFWARQDDQIALYAGANFEIQLRHVHDTGFKLTNNTNAVELQFVDANESIGSDGTNLLLKSGGNSITVPTAAGTMAVSGQDITFGVVTATDFNTTSDETLKKNIGEISDALDLVDKLQGVNFTWKANDVEEIGLIAQEVEKVVPKVVSTDSDGIKSIKYGNLVALLIQAIREQKDTIDSWSKKIDDLNSEVRSVKDVQAVEKLGATQQKTAWLEDKYKTLKSDFDDFGAQPEEVNKLNTTLELALKRIEALEKEIM
tara:strand:- start:3323 stop:7123 length:3801 start_codon:yes stop_codon:yes gene_type:complete